MNKKRDIIEEIELKKVRSNYPSKYNYLSRFWGISTLANKIGDEKLLSEDKEILRYIPLASIAATETFFRLLFQEIIDKGEPYFRNAIKLFKEQGNIKFDTEYLIPLQGKQVTVGEIFSHLLPVNNLNDINSILTKILGFDFLSSLKTFSFSQSMVLKKHSRKFKGNFGTYIESVNRLFEYRHILAHEFALNIELDKEKMLQDFHNLEIFIEACDFAITKTIGVYLPTFQQGMNIASQKKYKKSQSELDKLLTIIKRNGQKGEQKEIGDKRLFNKSFKEWEKFRDTYAQSIAATYKGGSIYSFIYWTEMEKQTTQMIGNLKESFSLLLKKNTN